MTEKIVRGQLLNFKSTPRDPTGEIVTPDSVKLYLNYVHADGTTSTDPAIEMASNTDGTFTAQFDTKICEPGPAFASVRAENPSSADDIKFTITANAANPDPV